MRRGEDDDTARLVMMHTVLELGGGGGGKVRNGWRERNCVECAVQQVVADDAHTRGEWQSRIKEREKNQEKNRLTKRTREAASDRTAVKWTWGGQREGRAKLGMRSQNQGVEGRWREEERRRGDGRVKARGPGQGSRAGLVPLPTACRC